MHRKASASSEGNILAKSEKQVELLKSFQQILAEENALYENTERQYIEAIDTTQHLVPFTDMQRRQRHRYVSRLRLK